MSARTCNICEFEIPEFHHIVKRPKHYFLFHGLGDKEERRLCDDCYSFLLKHRNPDMRKKIGVQRLINEYLAELLGWNEPRREGSPCLKEKH